MQITSIIRERDDHLGCYAFKRTINSNEPEHTLDLDGGDQFIQRHRLFKHTLTLEVSHNETRLFRSIRFTFYI